MDKGEEGCPGPTRGIILFEGPHSDLDVNAYSETYTLT